MQRMPHNLYGIRNSPRRCVLLGDLATLGGVLAASLPWGSSPGVAVGVVAEKDSRLWLLKRERLSDIEKLGTRILASTDCQHHARSRFAFALHDLGFAALFMPVNAYALPSAGNPP